MFFACSKTLTLEIKAFCAFFDCIAYDSLLYFSTVCDISFCTFEVFFQNFYEIGHLVR